MRIVLAVVAASRLAMETAVIVLTWMKTKAMRRELLQWDGLRNWPLWRMLIRDGAWNDFLAES